MTPTSPAPTPFGPDWATGDILAWVERRVSHWGHCWRLQPADLDDACEGAMVAVVRVLRHYDPTRVVGPADRSLDALLELVVFRALCNFRRMSQRLARHYDTSVDVNRILDDEAAGRCEGRPLVSAEEDPAEVAERHEVETLLAEVARSLMPEENRLYELWRSGASLAEIARQLGVTVKVVRRRLSKLWAKLSGAVGRRSGAARLSVGKPP